MPTNCTIAVSSEFREKLRRMKICERDTYEAVIIRLFDENASLRRKIGKKCGSNKESSA